MRSLFTYCSYFKSVEMLNVSSFVCEPLKYKAYRPLYPDELFLYLKKISNQAAVVLECGSGSGQATISLARHFNQIVTVDTSFDLLLHSPKQKNVLYLQSDANYLPIQNNSVDMICVVQALHWFDLEIFYAEVRRVIKSNYCRMVL